MRGRARIKPGYGVPKPWHTPLLLLLFTPAGLEQTDSSWPLPDTTRAPSIKKLSLTSQSGQNSKVSCYSL